MRKKVKEEEIEIIDIEDDLPKPKKQLKKRKLKKNLLFQTIFCSLSIIFIIGCIVFYGNRLIKYYKIYNPKDENGNSIMLMGNHITSGASFVYEGDGLYLNNGVYIYKGEKVDNYVKISNLLWRILKINEDKSIDVILDSSINNLKWNNNINNYSKSDINKYLTEEILPLINKDLITNTNTCNDKIDDITKISCNNIDSSNTIRLLNIDEFLNSKVDDKTFISENNTVWLSSRGEEKVWAINGSNLSYVDVDNYYGVKPVITLKNTNQVIKGKGTKEDPYIIENKNEEILGEYIKLGNDIWTVYKTEKDKLYLTSTKLLDKTYRYDLSSNKYNPDNKASLAKYLNEDYYNQLSYKEILIDNEWYIGNYNDSYSDIFSEKITAKVGLSSIVDFKFDNEINNYYLLNGDEKNSIYYYNEGLSKSKVTLSRQIKPSICIKTKKIKDGNGTLDNPYILED